MRSSVSFWYGYLLLPDVVPRSVTAPVLLFEEVGLHWCFVDCNCTCEEAKGEDDGQADARLQVDLQSPDHGYGDQREEQVSEDVDRGVEDSDVLENGCVVAFSGAGWRAQGVIPTCGYGAALKDDGKGRADSEAADEDWRCVSVC